ncbi:MAG: ATPase [Clostridia bacterium]|nr:ATPase [Clostridia bacterium]
MSNKINTSKSYLGIELGSTRIKAVLIDDTFTPIANASHEWENKLENGYWTYSLEAIHKGIQNCFADLSRNVESNYGQSLTTVGAIGISGMMHGYLAFDADENLLTPFRTWRNTTTACASKELTELFDFNIPQRWSIAHLYQAIIDREEHVSKVARITTLAGYIHFLLTGTHEVGIGEASGMFPVKNTDYDSEMISKFNDLVAQKGYDLNIRAILPIVKMAGSSGTVLSEQGAKFLDPSGRLLPGIPMCPPEGDAGTGMTATNAVLPKTGNISAGTSIFAMLVLDKPLKNLYPEIDVVTTPDGDPVAMVHCNNCSSELDAWVRLFAEFSSLAGTELDRSRVYELLFTHSLSADADCGKLCAYNYLSGEHITGVESGKPMYFRTPDSDMTLANFMRAQLYSTMSTLKIGMDILFENEDITAECFMAHGGLFKTKGVAQQILSDAMKTPVSVMDTAGEGGAWGMALLAAYMMLKKGKKLGQWLAEDVFERMNTTTLTPSDIGAKGFDEYITRYKLGLDSQKRLAEV